MPQRNGVVGCAANSKLVASIIQKLSPSVLEIFIGKWDDRIHHLLHVVCKVIDLTLV